MDFNSYASGYKAPKKANPDDPETQGFDQAVQPPAQSFSEMQKQGQARPAAPSYNPQTPPPDQGQFGGAQFMPVNPMYSQNMPAPTGGPNVNPQMSGGATAANGGLESQLRDAYQGYKPGVNPFQPQGQAIGSNPFSDPTQGSQLSGSTMQSILGALQNPSRYDSSVVQDSFNRLSGQIDDDYNGRDQNLRTNIASRGLGSIGDSSIGTADARFQNLQRRSAKQDMASNILRDQAATFGNDRSQALAQAMGYSGQNFGQGLAGWQANQNANQNAFGNQLATYGANLQGDNQAFQQRQQSLQNLLGYGQQSFNNEVTTAQMNNGQDNSYRQWLASILGGG